MINLIRTAKDFLRMLKQIHVFEQVMKQRVHDPWNRARYGKSRAHNLKPQGWRFKRTRMRKIAAMSRKVNRHRGD